jgi:uracil-DNA glycosylase
MINFNEETIYKDSNYNDLYNTRRACEACDLKNERTQVVVGHGNVPSKIMIIGEGPGAQEDEEGKPFIGRAGKLLTEILQSVGIDREKHVYITNTVKCRPPKNRTPLPTEIEACKPYLIRQIQLIKPRILLCLGAPSLKTILEETKTISKVRGKWYKVEVGYMSSPLYVMPLFHPSYLLRNQSKEKGSPKWLMWQDIKEVKAAFDYYDELTAS